MTQSRRRLSRGEMARLAARFAAQKTRESGPDEGGVRKSVVGQMIRAAAVSAARRQKKTK